MEWAEHTAIKKEKLASHIFEFDNSEDFKLEVWNYEIEIDSHGVRKRSEFINYIKNQTPKFVYSEHKRKEIRSNGGWPYDKARRKIGNISNKSDGFYSEILLYLIMEGFFDSPLVSHKMAVKEDYNTQVKGTDGLYIGTYDGDQVLGYGEAKFYQEKSNALTDAFDGLSDYHGVEGIDEREAEIDVARENISEDLEKSEINELLDEILHLEQRSPIIHPVLIAYEKEDYKKLKRSCETRGEAIDTIREFHEREKFIDLVQRRVEGSKHLEQIKKLVFFLRVENTQQFKDDLEGLI